MSNAPQFLQALPAETDATDGDIVTFQVKVDSPEKTQVTWWRCGEMLEPLPGRREIIHHGDGWHELIISNISEEDDGEYECRVENEHGSTSCFGSLYYYQQGALGTCTDVTLEGSFPEEGDGRQSALLIVIDDGSHTEEGYSGATNRKSLTVSEQMQGIIEDLTQSSQGEHTGSITMEKEDDEQFNSDIEIEEILDEALRKTRESQDTLVPDIPSPDSADKAMSEGSKDPFASKVADEDSTRCRSNPTNVSNTSAAQNYPWPPEAVVTFDLPPDVSTTSAELPPIETEEATKFSNRTFGGDTPFGVADIVEESVDVPCGIQDGSTGIVPVGASELFSSEELVASVTDQQVPPLKYGVQEAPTLTSVTELQLSQESGLIEAGADYSNMFTSTRSSFRSTSLRYSTDGADTSVRTTAASSRISSIGYAEGDVEATATRSTRATRALEEDESISYSAKRSKVSAYEADESSVSSSIRSADGLTIQSDRMRTDSPLEGAKPLDVYIAIMDFRPMDSDEEAVPMKEGQEVEVIDASKPRRWLVRTRPIGSGESPREGWVPACYLEKSTAKQTISSYTLPETVVDPKKLEAIENREAVVRELVETEEDFSKDMQFVVENYIHQLDDPEVPKPLRDRKSSIFGNFKDICDFHNNVLMKGVYYHAKEPTKLGKTFLRLERDFDMHTAYCWNEARAQRLLKSDKTIQEYFDNFSQAIGDDKTLTDHLKLPIQRLNDYQLLLREIIKYSSRLNEDTADLQKALDFIHGINKRSKDLQCIQSMQGCTGDMLKLGRIIRHDTFDVFEESSDLPSERHVFLFKGRIVIAEKQTSASGNEVYQVTNIFKIQEVDFVENLPDDEMKILLRHSIKSRYGFPLLMKSKSLEQKTGWLKEVASNAQVSEDLGDDEPILEKLLTDTKSISEDQTVPEQREELKHRTVQEPEEQVVPEPKPKKTKTEPVEQKTDRSSLDKSQKSVQSEQIEENIPKPERPKAEQTVQKPKSSQNQDQKQTESPKKTTKRQASVETAESPQKKTSAVTQDKRVAGKEQTSLTAGETKESVHKAGMADKPHFVKPLKGVTCTLGENAKLECQTEGSPAPSVTWLKDNHRLKKNSRIETVSKDHKHSLTIKDTKKEDGGLYTAVANNSQGSASCSAPLNVKVSPLLGVPKEDSRPSTPGGTILPHAPVFKVKLNKETQLLEGTCVRFELVVRGQPEPVVKFYKDDKELKQDDRVRVSYESKEVLELILDHVSNKDAGKYSCVATNSMGSDTTTGNLSVVKNKDVFRGLEECFEEEREPSLSPRPKTPKFKWFKDGQDFEASERFQVMFSEEEDSLALMFQHVTPDDAGLYTCVASTSTGSKIACSAELTVQGVVRQAEAPSIKAHLSDVEATEGGSAMLDLKITGYPKPKVTWLHKDKEVSTGGRFRFLFADDESFTLVIKNVKKEDGGQYTVKAVNEIGEAQSSCQMTVKSAPSFIKGLKDMSVMSEEAIVLEIQADGIPFPDVKWYKGGQLLKASDRIKISDLGNKKYSLKLEKAKLEDSGSYSCVITNPLGSQAEFSNVVVKASPTFIKGMENIEGLEGESLHFSVEVSGNPKPTLKWLKDGKELKVDGKQIKVVEEGVNAYSLVIENAALANVGAYTCELRNEHGMKASSGNLSLKCKPEFVKKLTDMEVNEGDVGLNLAISVKGYPSPTIKWFCDGNELSESKNFALVSEPEGQGGNLKSHSLKIKKVTCSEAGKYTCEAKNEMGSVSTSGVLSVKVTKKKPEFDQKLQPTQLTEEKPGKLVAKVSGQPKPTLKWLKDGKPISLNGHYSVEEEPDGTITLKIDKVSPGDAGVYSIVAVSDEGEAKCEAPVTTIPAGRKPEFIKDLEEVNLMEGQPLLLTAKITGNPTSVKWQKDGKDLSPTDHIALLEQPDGTVSLKVDHVNSGDAGKYAVIASNAEGKARSAALVVVKACSKPSIDSSLEPLTLSDGETGCLKVKVNGEPKPTLKWLKDGKELKTSNRVSINEEPEGTFVLEINNARPEDAGKYTVIAENSRGTAESAAPVTVNQAPTFQKQLQMVDVVEGYPAKLEAKLSGSPPPEIKWLKDGQQLIPDGTHIKEVRSPDGNVALLIDDSKPEDAGSYSLLAKNDLGEKASDGALSVTGKSGGADQPESVPSFVKPLGDVNVREGDALRFEPMISGNPLPNVTWVLNEEDIKPSDAILMTFDGKKAILEIKECKPEHSGTYRCIISNPLGKASSEGQASVEKKTAPRFIQTLADYNGIIGNPLILSCRVKGFPEPEISWYFNGDKISQGSKYSITKAGDLLCLSVNSCEVSDSGVFECRASNAVGEDATRSTVSISDKVQKGEPPAFLKKIGDCEAMEGMTAKFTACITGIPTPDVKWSKDGQALDLSPRHKCELESTGILRLIIRDIDPSDYGEYSVAISNPHGSATSSAHIRPDSLDQLIKPFGEQFIDFDKFKKTGAPVPLAEKPRIVRMSEHALTLAWKPSVPNAPRVPVTYQIEMAKHPGGEYEPYRTGLRDTLCDVRGLEPGQDYKFRIRVENKFGVSEPSPYTTAHRSKLIEPFIAGDYKPKDYEIEHPPLEKYAAPPRFVRKEEDAMYGVKGQPVTIEFWLYGQPQPDVTWYKDDVKIDKTKYGFLQDRNGKLSVFIDCMNDDYVGTYLCHAVNTEGEARMKIKLLLAEHPFFIQKLDETTALNRRCARMQCRVVGVPYPKIKWYRDWHPLYESDRVKILWEEPDKCTLFLSNLIMRDAGLFSCSATNIAGTVSTSASLNVEDSEDMFERKTYSRPVTVRPRSKAFEDFYDIGDELGRGTQGIINHAVKRDTGDSFAAKMMTGTIKFKNFMRSEMEVMNQLCHPKLVRLWDAFDSKNSLKLVTDLCGGGELLDNILKRGTLTEREVAHYIKQLLEGLEHMHGRYIGHLGLTVGDMLVSRVNSYDIKVGDFGLAAHLIPGKDYFLEYGHPEFVAPEIANKQPASLLSDMWSVGVITYLLLSGLSPFLGEHDRETLTKVQQGKINFSETAFSGVTDDAKDFMSKLLVFDPSGRINVKTALQHRWIKDYAGIPTSSDKPLGNIERLKDYYRKWKDWYANASCKHCYRRRTLESCFHHPSKMIYPPGECYSPEGTPEPETKRPAIGPSQFDDVTFKQKINREDIDFKSESNYQCGPDTYLLQLRDPDFPLRIRQYLRVGAATSPTLAASLRDCHWGDSTLVIKERRKFMDIMDEEIGDERKGLTTRTVPMRLYHEIGSLGFAHEQMELLKREVWKDKGSRELAIGAAPYFREKIHDTVMKENDEVVFTCFAVGPPKPDCAWFRNDGILLESSRVVVTNLKDGRSQLRINPSRAYDVGVYKCVARNEHGMTICRARLRIGDKPGRPDPPEVKQVSGTEIYLTWAPPRDDGHCPTLCYALEYKKTDSTEWTELSKSINHEYFVVRNLQPSTSYEFRIKAFNKFGWGEVGFATRPVKTKEEGAESVKVSPYRKFQQELSENCAEYIVEDQDALDLDYSRENNPVEIVEGEIPDLYSIVSEMDRGRLSVVLNVWVKKSNTSSVAKVIKSKPGAASDGQQEYEVLKSLCHERIVNLLSASHHGDKTVLVMEKLSGVDVLTYLSLRKDYNEELVVKIIRQVLDAIEYLHFRGICYIELQPDNVVMVDQRRPDIKLVDFGSSRFVPKSGGKVLVEGTLEYLAPEVLKHEEVSTGTDVWCIGILTYILLSGVSPFRGKTDDETTDNVIFVRYEFDNLYKNVTIEATRFLLNIFKSCPIKRLTVAECLENKWLAPSEYMILKRETALFLPDKLAAFARQFHSAKADAMDPEMLTSLGLSSSKVIAKDEDF